MAITSSLEPSLYFAGQFREWLGSAAEAVFLPRLETMYLVLRDEMHMVVIDLEADDDAQDTLRL